MMPRIVDCALWLQRELGAHVFAVDHPDLATCAGAHRPGQPCDGTRGNTLADAGAGTRRTNRT